MIDKFKSAFKEESEELLGQLESYLLEIEASPKDPEPLNAAFRAVHTIKGSAGMFGFEAISHFAHEFENLMDGLRNGTIEIDRDLMDLCLRARDHIRTLLGVDGTISTEDNAVSQAISAAFKEKLANADVQRSKQIEPIELEKLPKLESDENGESTYRIFFKPNPDIFSSGTKILKILSEVISLGECDIFAQVADIPALSDFDPEKCYCSWEMILTTSRGENAIRDVFIFLEGRAELRIEAVDPKTSVGGFDQPKRLGEILVERGLVTQELLSTALQSQRRLGEVLIDQKLVSKDEIGSALAEQEHLKKQQDRSIEMGASSVRVASEKLDQLVDLVGELVTLQARLSRVSSEIVDTELSSISEQFDRLIAQLRDNTMSIRMLPIGSTFNKFKRVVRDLSADLGKDVELLTDGGETELDKTVIERLNDPLIHIIRNSLDHGIESPNRRISAGKSNRGTITLSAMHSGAYVLIKVEDDGAGIDTEAVRAKAIERGLISSTQDLTEQEIYQLLFQPGFSTAKLVSSVSGRGVGMDVVKREIDSLGGSVIVSSIRGKGTVMTLKIPLTLAIIDGLLVRIGTEFFVAPLSSVDGCIEIESSVIAQGGGKNIVHHRGDLLPYVNLREYLQVPGDVPPISQIVIASAQESSIGFVVDQIIGDYQTVIKPLGRLYKDAEGLSGATILGDGTVALILDINRLSESARTSSAHSGATV